MRSPGSLKTPDLLDTHETDLPVAVLDLGPAGCGCRGGRIDELEQHILLGLEYDGRRRLGLREHIRGGCAHHQHAPVTDRLLLDPGDRACRIAHLEPAFDADDDLERVIATECE